MNEQELPPDVSAELPPMDEPVAPEGDLPPMETAPMEEPPMETLPAETEDTTEEIDITDLVNMTKSIKMDMDDKKGENNSVLDKMDDVFTKLNDLEQKLSQMDTIISKIDEMGYKVENMKEKTPEEKLEMRSLDSYPFNQNPQEFFAQKQDDMRASGKNEYVLTKQDVVNYPQETIKTSFNPEENDKTYRY